MRALSADATVLAAFRRLHAAAPGHCRSVGEIATVAGLEPGHVRSALIRLCLRGSVGRAPGGRYVLGSSRAVRTA